MSGRRAAAGRRARAVADPYQQYEIALSNFDALVDVRGNALTSNGEVTVSGGKATLNSGYIYSNTDAKFALGASDDLVIELLMTVSGSVFSQYNEIFGIGPASQVAFPGLIIAATYGTLFFYAASSSTGTWDILPGTAFTNRIVAGVQTYIALSRNAGVWRGYCDGVRLFEKDSALAPYASASPRFSLGLRSDGNPGVNRLKGSYDAYRITKDSSRNLVGATIPVPATL